MPAIITTIDKSTRISVPLELLDLIVGRAESLAAAVSDIELLAFIRTLDLITDGQREEGK